jgi:hypothetical protein
MSKPNQNADIKNPNKGASGQNKIQNPKPGNREEQMNPPKDQVGKKR